MQGNSATHSGTVEENFAEDLYKYLWRKQKVNSKSADNDYHRDTEFTEDIGKTVVLHSNAIRVSCQTGFKKVYPQIVLSRRKFFSYVTLGCSEIYCDMDDICEVFLNTASFINEIMLFCFSKGHEEYLDFAPICWVEAFRWIFKEDFYAAGGWKRLREFIEINNLVELYAVVEPEIENSETPLKVISFFEDDGPAVDQILLSQEDSEPEEAEPLCEAKKEFRETVDQLKKEFCSELRAGLVETTGANLNEEYQYCDKWLFKGSNLSY